MSLNTLGRALDDRRRAGARGFWSRIKSRLGFGARRVLPHDNVAFTAAFVALGAKMAMADGVAVKAEAQAFARFLEVPPGEEANIARLYDQARQDTTGFEYYAARINEHLTDAPELKRDVLECLLYIACADGMLHPAEDRFLRTVATSFEFSETAFVSIRALFVHDADSPYAVLGLDAHISDRDLKIAYRKLLAEFHPDRLMAEGAGPAVIKAATAKMASINAAYDSIVAERASRARVEA